MNRPPVTLHVSLAPSDYRHARELLPHQVRAWGGQVDEILLAIDFHRSAGRFAAGWEEGRDGIRRLAESIPHARVVAIDYAPAAARRVAEEFFGGRAVPAKDFRGGPYYSYFFGLHVARHDHVLHCDSDLFFGGGSQTWIAEALASLAARPEVLCTAPLPGPPAADGRLRSQEAAPDPAEPFAFTFAGMSTRVFLFSRSTLRRAVGALRPEPPPSWRSRIKAVVERNPAADLPEHVLSRAMRRAGLVRREFLGSGSGMWSLHPPYRSADFYLRLPELIRRVEAGEMPAAQRGDHDLNSSLVDWSEPIAALRRNRWWRRALRPRA